jgi:hypothetical protein
LAFGKASLNLIRLHVAAKNRRSKDPDVTGALLLVEAIRQVDLVVFDSARCDGGDASYSLRVQVNGLSL